MTAGTASTNLLPRLSVGWVVRKTFVVVGRRWPGIAALSALFALLPTVIAMFIPDSVHGLANVVTGLPLLVFDGAVVLITYRELEGPAPISSQDAVQQGFRRFFPLWGLGIITGIAEVIGVLLLIVPGLILLVGWLPATAVLMIEGCGPMKALDRAWTLTRGERWRIAAVVAIFSGGVVALFLPLVLAGAAIGAMLGSQGPASQAAIGVAAGVWAAALYAFAAVGGAVVYAGLRQVKEGASADIAAVFA